MKFITLLFATMVLAVTGVLADDLVKPDNGGLPEWVFPVATAILALIGAGLIKKIHRLLKEVRELLRVVSDAIKDLRVDNSELAGILKELSDVGTAAKDIMKAVAQIKKR